jgi:hypothetical protein
MARRRKEAVSISLVPILSIQKCAMGVMVVIICAQNTVSLAVSLGQKDDQILEVAGSVQDKEAVFVECQDKGILIHPEKTAVSLETLKGPAPSPYLKLLDTLQASGGKKYLVLLLRPEGIPTYHRCFDLAMQRKRFDPNFHVGKDALLTGGNVVLTKGGKPILTKKGGA